MWVWPMGCEVGAEIPNGTMMEGFGEKTQEQVQSRGTAAKAANTEQVRVGVQRRSESGEVTDNVSNNNALFKQSFHAVLC